METKNILEFQSEVPKLARDEGLTDQKCKDNPMSFKKSRTANDRVFRRYRIKEFWILPILNNTITPDLKK